MIFRWKKQLDRGWRAALVPAANETGFAVVQNRKGDSPLLQHYGVLPTFEVKAEHVLAAMLPSRPDLVSQSLRSALLIWLPILIGPCALAATRG